MKNVIDFNELRDRHHGAMVTVGWWDDPDQCVVTKFQLVSTEIAEATEGDRKKLMDDKLPHRTMAEVELADVVLRIVDMAGAYGWTYDSSKGETSQEATLKEKQQILVNDNVPSRHFLLNTILTSLYGAVVNYEIVDDMYSLFLNEIVELADKYGYDLVGAIKEKIVFNANRLDHKREERAKKNGKGY